MLLAGEHQLPGVGKFGHGQSFFGDELFRVNKIVGVFYVNFGFLLRDYALQRHDHRIYVL